MFKQTVESLKSKGYSFKDIVSMSRSLTRSSKSDLFKAYHD